MDIGLLNQLKNVSENKDAVFFVPSFKHISRNIEKLLKVLEFLLYANIPIVTPNYYFTSNDISFRQSLIKPIHNSSHSELMGVLKNTMGTTKEHAKILRCIAKQLDEKRSF
jgi:hypothetical protein